MHEADKVKMIEEDIIESLKIEKPLPYVPKESEEIEMNPSEKSRKYSSVYSDDSIGTGHARSVLNSGQAWSAKTNDKNQWMSIDAGKKVKITALIMQARGHSCED
jgi:hypothetical protein